jgi:hypothetical protein
MPNVLTSQALNQRADSVLDLLIAQCADLEVLLALARREEQATAAKNFDEILRVVAERATLGERLEVYQRQIAALRQQLGAAAETALQSDVARQTVALITEIQTTDNRTRPLLLAARSELLGEQQRLAQAQRGVTAYLRDGRTTVACDRRI